MCYLYYPWYMQICSTGVFLFFLPVQVNTPAGLKGQEVTRSLLLLPPQIAPPPPHCGPTSWPSLLRCDVCRSVDGGSSSGRCLSWKMGRCSFFFFPERVLPFSFSCWIVWPLLKAKSWTREKGPVVEALAASQTMSKVVGRRVNVLQKSAQKLVPFLHWLTV